jgi:hypothetical protein
MPNGPSPDLSDYAEWVKYKPGVVTFTGVTVKEVLQVSPQGIVFINDADELQWEYEDSTCSNGVAATAEAAALIAQLGLAGFKREKLHRAQVLIAAGLSCAFDDREPQCERHFAAAKDLVRTRQTERLQTAYLLAVLIAAILLSASGSLIVLRTGDVQREFAIGVTLGIIGALISVSQRFRSIAIDRYSSVFFTVVAGTARVLFGGLFGLALVILQKSGIVLAGIEGNIYALAAAALVAGFSERAIPDLFGKVESTFAEREREVPT